MATITTAILYIAYIHVQFIIDFVLFWTIFF